MSDEKLRNKRMEVEKKVKKDVEKCDKKGDY